MRALPNILTIFRLLLVVPICYWLWTEWWLAAFIGLGLAGISDALDGALARRFSWTSKFGETADPLADKLLFGVVIVLLTIKGHVPLWVTVTVLARDVVILGGAATYRILFHNLEITPMFMSKVNTALQIVVLIVVLASLVGLSFAVTLMEFFIEPFGWVILAAFAVFSGGEYVYEWGKKTRNDWRAMKETPSSS